MGILSRIFGFGRVPERKVEREPSDGSHGWASPRERYEAGAPIVPHVDGDGSYEFDIVGESNYQDNLTRIAGGKTEDGHELECRAVLVLEPTNPHDANAIRVEINGLVVGYIPRGYAPGMSDVIRRHAPAGRSSVNALIVGGWQRSGGREGSFGVKLDIDVGADDEDED